MILLNDFARQWRETGDEVLRCVAAVGESGWYILGNEVRCFEAALAALWGREFAVGVASGLDAIEISLAALGCARGDAVLTTPLSAFATTLAIVKLGAVPVFADTDDRGLLDLEVCRAALRDHPEIRFLVPVHLYGHALDRHKLEGLRQEFGCRIVEDCAQSVAARHDGVPAGCAGHAAATSFYPTKNLGALGDGGAILTSDPELAAAARALRDYGQTAKYRHDYVGYNSRLDELHAAVLARVYLPRLERWTARRRAIAAAYQAGISNPALRLPGAPSGSASVWHLFPVLVTSGSKAAFREHLAAAGIASGEHYPALIPEQNAMRGVPFRIFGSLTRAARIAASEVSLPIHPYLDDSEVTQVIETCNRWVA